MANLTVPCRVLRSGEIERHPCPRSLLDVLGWLGQSDSREPVTLWAAAQQPQPRPRSNDIRKINADKQKAGAYGYEVVAVVSGKSEGDPLGHPTTARSAAHPV